MFNSIFRKQFITYMGILILSFTLLGTVLSQALENYFVSAKEKLLAEQGEKIASIIRFSGNFGNFGIITRYEFNEIEKQVQILHKYAEASFIFLYNDYTVAMTTSDLVKYNGTTLDVEEIKNVMNGETVATSGRLGGVFEESVLTVASPVIINEQVVGAVLLTSPISELQTTVSDVFKILLTCLLVSGVIAFVLVYFSARAISNQLKEMNEAAKVIASGDFEKRIDVKTTDEVGQLGESFNDMAESLHKQEMLRNEFIANVSHDIRSPLTSVKGFLQAILDGTIPPEKQGKYLNIIMQETERLTKLANDILDLNKAQTLQSKLDISCFNINELIKLTSSVFETRAKDKNISIALQLLKEQTIVCADYEKIQRVIVNLLDNAIKFSGEGAEIEVETAISGGKVLVSVKDHGIGISQEEQRRVFDRFYKVDQSRGNDKSGSGLGLSIVKAFIKAHGENIVLSNTYKDGCLFTFSLPLAGGDSQ